MFVQRTVGSAREDSMKAIVFAMVAGAGIFLATSSQASATAANGAVFANIGHQIDPVINVATKKKRGRCRPDYKRDRNGYCRFNTNTL
jgi:hypothetical protein